MEIKDPLAIPHWNNLQGPVQLSAGKWSSYKLARSVNETVKLTMLEVKGALKYTAFFQVLQIPT